MEEDIFSAASADRRREHEIDEIWTNFQRGTEGSNVMLASDFKKYEVLFSSELKKKYLEHRLSSEEINTISDLSQEFYHRINPQAPLHIVDQYGKEVCPPIPPIFRHLNSLDGTARNGDSNVIDIFHHTFSVDETAGALAENRKKAAAYQLNDVYVRQQSREDIIKDTKQFDAMSEMFHKEVLHNDPYTKQPRISNSKVVPSNSDSDDDVEWD